MQTRNYHLKSPSPLPVQSIIDETSVNNIKDHHEVHLNHESDRADIQVIARIRDLGTYANDWNGPGTLAPTHATIEDAESFTCYLFSLGPIMTPHICASGDGAIDFYWKQNGFTLDLGFAGDGSYSYYANLPNGQEMIEDEAALNEHLPQSIVDLITNIV